jgi:heme o synthase
VLFFIVFLLQFPHFMAIAWMYRADYSRAGYHVLPAEASGDRFVIWQSFASSLALIPMAFIASATRDPGAVDSVLAALLSLAFLYFSGRFPFHRSNITARQLLVSSVLYLPLLFTLLVWDKK